MSQFYGTLNGNRGEATRCGTKKSGIVTHAASWKGAVRACVYWNEEEQEDWAIVTLTQWQGAGCYPPRELYNGPVGGPKTEGK